MFTRHDRRVLEGVAQGRSARDLAEDGLYPTEKAALGGVAALGRALSGGEFVRWSRIVHLAVLHRILPPAPNPGPGPGAGARPDADADQGTALVLPPYQLDLLRAYAAGIPLAEYAHRSQHRVSLCEARELRALLCLSLGASGSVNAVYLGHRHRLLDLVDMPTVAFGAPSLSATETAGPVS
ncbi:hypothetical protein ACFWXK_22740 [Streptomyces sp. NPDC059070]|uniref:hypothetical protein n=1 Tax=Streptomyces sp. NPDC059070 TaxID=3346713 RepID=UPI0036BC4D72